ncbi:MAG: hypothetical protein RL042_1533 [Nitrospirota bacterium]
MELPGEKLIVKLWETLTEKGIGSLLSPWQIKREGRARNEVRREELLTIAQVELEVADIRAGRKRFDLPGSVRLISGTTVGPATAHVDAADRAEPTLNFQAVAKLALSYNAADAVREEINTSKAVVCAEDILSNDSQFPQIGRLMKTGSLRGAISQGRCLLKTCSAFGAAFSPVK